MPCRFQLRALLVLAGLMPAGTVLAQAIEPPPYRAVFGAASRESRKHDLGMSLGVQEAIGNDGSASQFGPSSDTAGSGSYTGFGVDGRYDWRGKTARLGVSGGTWFRYYNREGQLVTESRQAVATFSNSIGRSTNFVVSQALTYTPTYFYGMAPRDAASPGAADPTSAMNLLDQEDRAQVRTTTASLSKNVMRRGVLSVSSSLSMMAGQGPGVDRRPLTSYDVGGGFTYGLNRDVSLVLGYRYSTAAYADGSKPVTHDIDAGIDYHKALSISRRTTFTSSAGSAIVSGPANSVGGVSVTQRQFQVRASGQLAHQISRTWQLSGIYQREVGYAQELRTPVLTSGWTASIGGFAGRRIDLGAFASYSTGSSAFTGESAFITYNGGVTARLAISRTLAATANYQYYRHNFSQAADVTVGIPRHLSSNSLRVGLSFWIPLRQR